MKKFTIILACSLFCSALFLFNFQLPSQSGPEKPDFSKAPFETKTTPGWYKIAEGETFTTDYLLKEQKANMGFTAYDDLEHISSKTDQLGYTHHRYEQYHRGVKVDASQLMIHEIDGHVSSFNGKWVHNLNKIVSPKLSPNQAIQKALQYLPADLYFWEIEGAQKMLQKMKKDPQATYYPSAELVWFDPSFTQNRDNYRLAYSMVIQAQLPLLHEEVYIDAQTGELLSSINNIQHTNSNGSALTKYSGTRDIITDSLGVNSFRLRETNRGGNGVDIITLDLNQSTNYGAALDFRDTDNFWANINAEFDEAATDAHWGAEMTHDFLLEKFNYRGVDGNGLDFICYIHYDTLDNGQPSRNYVNAFWNGQFATFGDGNENTSPLTDIDIVAHEFGHGIDQFSSNLRYQGESGALDESYSDIWGATIEFWADPDQANWFIGEDSDIAGFGLRSMSDPNRNNDPDTYDGQFWGDPNCENPMSQDNCFVHSNSGVQNHWYYLLVEGGSGINDNDDAYDLPGLGLDTASTIAWRAQHEYLTRDATYLDALEAGLQATQDLYGRCSEEFITVANTWYAVGVGNGIFENDVEMKAILDYPSLNCGLDAEQFPTIRVSYRSCVPELTSGSKIPVAAQVDGGPITRDTILLTAGLGALDSLEFTFNRPVSGLETGGMHTLVTWTEFPMDDLNYNDTTSFTLENVIEQNSDFTTTKVPPLVGDCFLGAQNVEMEVLFLGCDMIPAGASIDMYYRANGGTPVSETTTLPNALFRGQTFNYTFNTPLDLTGQLGTNKIDFWVDLADDFLNENDTLLAQIARNPYLMVDKNLVTFEAEESSLDSVHFVTTLNSSVTPTNYFRFEEPNILQMSGGDFESLLAFSQVRIPGASNVWLDKNASIAAQACFCVDASDMVNVRFSFDLQQSFTRNWQALYGSENQYGSACRVVVDDTQVGDSYFPETLNSDPVTNRVFDLDAYAGTIFEVCIESRCGFSAEADAFNKGDLVRVDNVMIEGVPLGLNDLPQLSGIKVFPNPSAGSVNVTFESKEAKDLQLEVYDIYGRVITTLQRQTLNANQSHQFNLDQLAPGTYYFHFSNERGKKIEKVVLF